MDNEPVTAKSLSWTYMIQDNTFARAYKDTLSDFGPSEKFRGWGKPIQSAKYRNYTIES